MEDRSDSRRPEVMSYSSYEDARAREAELLRSARKHTVGSEPRPERRSGFPFSRLLEIVHLRQAPAQKPAVGRT